jgi:hypothetical protein
MAKTPELQRFYASRRWRDLRNMLVIERRGICDRCGKDCSADTSELIAHHKEHLTDETLKDPAVAVNPDNIEILCAKCHAHEHAERGFTTRKQVFIVYGSPLSGKTTYVRQNMTAGDLVVDLDALYSAITLSPPYVHHSTVRKTIFAIRDFLYDQIRIRNGDWRTAWIISGLPRKDERERLAARLGASLILVEATKEECHKRLLDCDDARGDEWAGYIDAWFRDYMP